MGGERSGLALVSRDNLGSVTVRARGKVLLLLAPLSAVLVVLLGVLVGGERPIRSARVYGGPTQGQVELSLRVELGQRDRVAEVPLPGVAFSATVVEGGQPVATTRGATDGFGNAEIRLRLPRPRDSALELWLQSMEHEAAPLARGLILGRLDALRAAPRRGGFQRGRSGDITLSVAPAHGVLVTGQGGMVDELLVRAERAALPVAAASVLVRLEGAEPAESRVETDERGLARVSLRPREASVRVRLEAVAPGAATGALTARFDVVQGAIRATREGGRLRLESSGAATVAWIGLFDQTRRVAGLHAELALSADGRLLADVPLPVAARDVAPLWAVVSSQADLASPSAVGWPLAPQAEQGTATLDARELLLLDGSSGARAREDSRARRIRLVTAGYAALSLLLTLYLFDRRVREAEATLAQHLERAGGEGAAHSVEPRRAGRALLAAACIGLGFLVLALLALFKR